MKTTAAFVVVTLAVAELAHGQSPEPSPDGPRIQVRNPPPRTVDSRPHALTVPGPPARLRTTAGGDALGSWRALALVEGKGRVAIGGVSREVARGQTVEGYMVRSVAPGRIVLARATPAGPRAPAGGTELAILLFAEGATRVVRVFDQDPTPQSPVRR
jgi:hypothetical protein